MKFIKVTGCCGEGEFYINATYIVTVHCRPQVILSNLTIPVTENQYEIEYYNHHNKLVTGIISKEDYDYLINNTQTTPPQYTLVWDTTTISQAENNSNEKTNP